MNELEALGGLNVVSESLVTITWNRVMEETIICNYRKETVFFGHIMRREVLENLMTGNISSRKDSSRPRELIVVYSVIF